MFTVNCPFGVISNRAYLTTFHPFHLYPRFDLVHCSLQHLGISTLTQYGVLQIDRRWFIRVHARHGLCLPGRELPRPVSGHPPEVSSQAPCAGCCLRCKGADGRRAGEALCHSAWL